MRPKGLHDNPVVPKLLLSAASASPCHIGPIDDLVLSIAYPFLQKALKPIGSQ